MATLPRLARRQSTLGGRDGGLDLGESALHARQLAGLSVDKCGELQPVLALRLVQPRAVALQPKPRISDAGLAAGDLQPQTREAGGVRRRPVPQ